MKKEEQRLLNDLYDRETREGWTYTDTSVKPLKEDTHPDPSKHQALSLLKSTIRMAGYGFIMLDMTLAVVTLIISEVVGIVEELV